MANDDNDWNIVLEANKARLDARINARLASTHAYDNIVPVVNGSKKPNLGWEPEPYIGAEQIIKMRSAKLKY